MKKVLAILLAGGKGERLYPLTRDRAKPAVTFGGIYRIIDFTLSNCVNSDIRQVYVLTQYKSLSLTRHIQLGWTHFSNKLGEFIQIASAQQRVDETWYRGTADAVYQNIYTLQQERPEQTLILSGDHIYKMDYRRLIEFHRSRGADLTVGAIEMDSGLASQFGVMEIDSESRVRSFHEKSSHPPTLPDKPNRILASMGIYVFNTEIMVKRLVEDAKSHSQHDFGKNVIPAMIPRDRVFAYSVNTCGERWEEYWRDVGTLDAYWEAHADLLQPIPPLDIFDEQWPIYTQDRPLPPTLIHPAARPDTGVIDNCIVSMGCRIAGAALRRSILSPQVVVQPGAIVEDCILMSAVKVGEGVKLRRAIVDKGVNIPPGMEIGYRMEDDARLFTVSDSGLVVIPRNEKLF